MNRVKSWAIAALLMAAPWIASGEALDLNTATAEQLANALTGVGKAKAEAIVKDREARGPFKSVEDLDRVKGIGKATLETNKGRLIVNTAAPQPTAVTSTPANRAALPAKP